jgi:hypothetical protein
MVRNPLEAFDVCPHWQNQDSGDYTDGDHHPV